MRKVLIFLAGFYLLGFSVLAQRRENVIISRLNNYFTAYETTYTTAKDRCKVEKVKVDAKRKRLSIYVNELFIGQSFNQSKIKEIYNNVKRNLPSPYNNYKISIYGKKHLIEHLVNNVHENTGLSGRRWTKNISQDVWVTKVGRPYTITKGLANRHLSVYASHGRYYKHDKADWVWQRPYLYCTTEDLFTQTFVIPFLIPMLENAGAYVFTPRERDWQPNEVIVDNDQPLTNGKYHEYNQKYSWETVEKGFAQLKSIYFDGENPFNHGTARCVASVSNKDQISEIQWMPSFEQSGCYGVYVSYPETGNNVPDAKYVVCHKGIKTMFVVNQQMGTDTWVYLGAFDFDSNNPHENYVSLSNLSDLNGTIAADAVRFGGGMGNVARGDSLQEKVSGLPRYLEGARYNAQWSGMPYSIYSPKSGTNDYADDINVRSLMTNYLAGGSAYCPADSGLKVPIELSLAVHSDAGIAHDSTFIGTLGIYTTDFNEGMLSGGLNRLLSRDLCDVVMSQIDSDLTKSYGSWKRRAMYDRNYSESREPGVPSMILEILSHQNFKDLIYGHDPNFKFTMSRAIYKGLLKFLSYQHHSDYVVQPLPVTGFSALADKKANQIKLSWKPVLDSLEVSAKPDGYIVYIKEGTKDYDNGRFVRNSNFDFKALQNVMYSFKVTAVNEGGESFASEELCAMIASESKTEVLIIDGFQRVAGPQVVMNDTTRGFVMSLDPGVPFHCSPAHCGNQIIFDEAANSRDSWGLSGNELDGKMIAGNSFNHSLIHGEAIATTGIYTFSSATRSAVETDEVNLNNYHIVDLILGLQRNDEYSTEQYPTLTSELCNALSEYLRMKGNLMVSGAYLARDQKSEVSVNFLQHYLKIKAYSPLRLTSNTQAVGMNTSLSLFTDYNDIHYAVTHADCLMPDDGAFSTLLFAPSDLSAAVAYPGKSYRTISFGFPFECIEYKSDRARIMEAVLSFLLTR